MVDPPQAHAHHVAERFAERMGEAVVGRRRHHRRQAVRDERARRRQVEVRFHRRWDFIGRMTDGAGGRGADAADLLRRQVLVLVPPAPESQPPAVG